MLFSCKGLFKILQETVIMGIMIGDLHSLSETKSWIWVTLRLFSKKAELSSRENGQ